MRYSYSNPNGPYISVQSVRGFVKDSAAAKRDLDGGLRIAGSDKNNQPQQYSACGCVAHARRMGGSVEPLCSVQVVFCLLATWYMSVLCAHESLARGKNRQHFTGAFVQNKAPRTETRERVSSTPADKTVEGLPRAPEYTDRARTSTNVPAGLPVSTPWRFAKKCWYEDMCSKNYKNNHKHNYCNNKSYKALRSAGGLRRPLRSLRKEKSTSNYAK